jgi:hypothetical protein
MFAALKRLLGFKSHTFNKVVVFHMKSGDKLRIPCDEFTFKHSGGELQSYYFTGNMAGTLITVQLTEIESITQIPYSRFTNYLK